jgi:DNA processing protein
MGAISGKGSTVAVLGSGIERIYPAENKRLFHRIAENGAVVSELAPAAEPDGYNFPARNRIISGMSLGVVIVEATSRSGSLITARLALEQNREVFAVPGSIHSFKSTGTHTLIKQGAKLVEHARDIMEEFADLSKPRTAEAGADRQPPGYRTTGLPPEEVRVIETLGVYPVHIDDIVRKTEMAPGKLAGILLNLELKGAVRRSPGNFFSLCKDLHV